ncbi:MAG: haloalkane dehalogenase [Deltaproteobacteria bacterium]|nr:haloalkane dehalogenase [Deltaproteobacteria bacterium]MBW2724052.1 haloalkane dehalogenase [Deltaproteobacteria bacterium]
MSEIGVAPRYEKKHVEVNGKSMAYVEVGEGDPIVFLHGNPTSSYLWRNIMPYAEALGRCIAPDLIGMGDSEKLENSGPDRYRFVEHREYLDGLLDALGVEQNVILVIHDWGSALGFDWANRHREAVRGICYMEALVRPVSWDDWPEAARGIFQSFRSDAGEAMVLEKNVFVENVLPASVLRKLAPEEMAEYRRPFAEAGEDRRPTLTWPRQIPISGEPEEVVKILDDYGPWMSQNDVPKLFVNADPGSILIGPQREFCRGWKNQTEITVPGLHFIQEDSPDEIGAALERWIKAI